MWFQKKSFGKMLKIKQKKQDKRRYWESVGVCVLVYVCYFLVTLKLAANGRKFFIRFYLIGLLKLICRCISLDIFYIYRMLELFLLRPCISVLFVFWNQLEYEQNFILCFSRSSLPVTVFGFLTLTSSYGNFRMTALTQVKRLV